jgi:hypothetical protein
VSDLLERWPQRQHGDFTQDTSAQMMRLRSVSTAAQRNIGNEHG